MTANETIKQQVKHQMRIIKQGAVNLVGEEELEGKLKNSILTGKPLTVKFGMDPSAPDIHIGHAVVLRKLKQLQDMGNTIVIIDISGTDFSHIGQRENPGTLQWGMAGTTAA